MIVLSPVPLSSPVSSVVRWPMYVCRKMNNSQARTGHQRGMGGRGTDDDDTHEQHTDTNKLTRHTASVAATHPDTGLARTGPVLCKKRILSGADSAIAAERTDDQ